MKQLTTITLLAVLIFSCTKKADVNDNSDVTITEVLTPFNRPSFGVKIDYVIKGNVKSATLVITDVYINTYTTTIPSGSCLIYSSHFKYFYKVKKNDGLEYSTTEKFY
jgi:hypothetical protein